MIPVNHLVASLSKDGTKKSEPESPNKNKTGFLSKWTKRLGLYKMFSSNIESGSTIPESSTSGVYINKRLHVDQRPKTNIKTPSVSSSDDEMYQTAIDRIIPSPRESTSSKYHTKEAPLMDVTVDQLSSQLSVLQISSPTSCHLTMNQLTSQLSLLKICSPTSCDQISTGRQSTASNNKNITPSNSLKGVVEKSTNLSKTGVNREMRSSQTAVQNECSTRTKQHSSTLEEITTKQLSAVLKGLSMEQSTTQKEITKMQSTPSKKLPEKQLAPLKRLPEKQSTPQKDNTSKQLKPFKDTTTKRTVLQDITEKNIPSHFPTLNITSKTSSRPCKKSTATRAQSNSQFRHYKNIPLEPQVDEILSDRQVDVSRNVVNGPYKSPFHYLNVQFKLLREDFIAPLREGIQQIKRDFSDAGKLYENQHITLYPKCQFICMVARKKVIGYEFCFDVALQMVNNRWKTTRSLFIGTLLAFSHDNFKTFFFGSVALTNDHDMSYRRVITVELFNGKKLESADFSRSYAMLEPSSFFVPYYHVMKTLQTFSNENFPFEQYIINTKKLINAPVYFSKDNAILRCYDLSPNIKEELRLNSIQFKAYKTALTTELAIIQGPPGTGKTYVGLRIVEGFLKNKALRQYMDGPILLVCNTNHALDQFLEGVLRYTQNVCRLGCSKKNKNVKPYNYIEMLETFHAIQVISRSLKFVGNKDVFVRLEDFDRLFSPDKNGMYTMRVRSFKKDCIEKRKYTKQLLKAYFFMYTKSPCNRPCSVLEKAIKKDCYRLENDLERISTLISLINSFNGIVHVKYLEEFMDTTSLLLLTTPGALESWLTREYFLSDLCQLGRIQVDSECDDDSNISSSSNKSKDVQENVFFTLDLTGIQSQIEDTQVLLHYKKTKKDCQTDNHFAMDLNEIELESKLVKLRELYELMELMLNNLKQGNINMMKIESTIVKKISSNRDLYSMGIQNRWNLYWYWMEGYRRKLYRQMEKVCLQYDRVLRQFEDRVRHPELLNILQTKDVVAMTTTKAAKIHSVMCALKPKIVVIEEAAEVLETHIIASLTNHCEHMVLIGDHKQLRPGTSVHELARDYDLDVSLFERLVGNGLHHVTLEVQHRMRPEVCELLTPTIYTSLINHESVYKLQSIIGMESNVQFFDHKVYENRNNNESTISNEFEVSVLLNLSVYLLDQGYNPRDITIIAAYRGQVDLFEEKIDAQYKYLSDILVTTIDAYQGEENKIILLSLVRSNVHNNIGFLKTPNRVCVALSRAKQGLFIMGNMENLSRESKLWQNIKNKLDARRAIGKGFRLKCKKHKSPTIIRALEDFDHCCCSRRIRR